MHSVGEELERCSPAFVRLAVRRAVVSGEGLDAASQAVADHYLDLLNRDPALSEAHRRLFEQTLGALRDDVAALARHMNPETLTGIVRQTSEARVAKTLNDFLARARVMRAAPSPPEP